MAVRRLGGGTPRPARRVSFKLSPAPSRTIRTTKKSSGGKTTVTVEDLSKTAPTPVASLQAQTTESLRKEGFSESQISQVRKGTDPGNPTGSDYVKTITKTTAVKQGPPTEKQLELAAIKTRLPGAFARTPTSAPLFSRELVQGFRATPFGQEFTSIAQQEVARQKTKFTKLGRGIVSGVQKAEQGITGLIRRGIKFGKERGVLLGFEEAAAKERAKPLPVGFKLLGKVGERIGKGVREIKIGVQRGAATEIIIKPLQTAATVALGFGTTKIIPGLIKTTKAVKIAKVAGKIGATAFAATKGVEVALTPGVEAKGRVLGRTGVQLGAFAIGSLAGAQTGIKTFKTERATGKAITLESGSKRVTKIQTKTEFLRSKTQPKVAKGLIIKGGETKFISDPKSKLFRSQVATVKTSPTVEFIEIPKGKPIKFSKLTRTISKPVALRKFKVLSGKGTRVGLLPRGVGKKPITSTGKILNGGNIKTPTKFFKQAGSKIAAAKEAEILTRITGKPKTVVTTVGKAPKPATIKISGDKLGISRRGSIVNKPTTIKGEARLNIDIGEKARVTKGGLIVSKIPKTKTVTLRIGQVTKEIKPKKVIIPKPKPTIPKKTIQLGRVETKQVFFAEVTKPIITRRGLTPIKKQFFVELPIKPKVTIAKPVAKTLPKVPVTPSGRPVATVGGTITRTITPTSQKLIQPVISTEQVVTPIILPTSVQASTKFKPQLPFQPLNITQPRITPRPRFDFPKPTTKVKPPITIVGPKGRKKTPSRIRPSIKKPIQTPVVDITQAQIQTPIQVVTPRTQQRQVQAQIQIPVTAPIPILTAEPIGTRPPVIGLFPFKKKKFIRLPKIKRPSFKRKFMTTPSVVGIEYKIPRVKRKRDEELFTGLEIRGII